MAITIDLSALGPGTYTIEDDGTPGNGTSVIRGPTGAIITTFAHPADSLTILSKAGQNINVNFADSLSAGSLTIGSLSNAAQNPDNIQVNNVVTTGSVTLSANQAVSELGNDIGVDVFAGKLFIKAGTGVGNFGAIETATSVLEVDTATGGINIGNSGALTIGGGGGSALLHGLLASTSGNINLTNLGTITLADSDGTATVQGAGVVMLTAVGASSDITDTSAIDAVSATGSLYLNAGRDVLFGSTGIDNDNDVRAGGAVNIVAGRDFSIDGFSDLAANDFGLGTNGGVSIEVGRNILVNNATGDDASIGVTAGTGTVVLKTGSGGAVGLYAPTSSAVFSGVGGVSIIADILQIAGTSGITVTGNGTTTITTASAGREIELGGSTFFGLQLDDGTLDRIFSTNLIVGGANAGPINVDGALSLANTNLALVSGSNISVNANISTPGAVTLISQEGVQVSSTATITTGAFTVQVDQPNTDSAVGGLAISNGSVAATSTLIQGAGDGDTLYGFENIEQTVQGGGGNDTIYSSGEGHYYGEGGNDIVFAGFTTSVQEYLDGGSGVDLLDTRTYSGDYIINMVTGATNYGETFVNFENLITSTGNDVITGNIEDNNIQTNGGNDVIDGGGGNDTMVGGLGNDVYYVDVFSDVVIEAGGEGTDRVAALNSYALAAGASIETLESTNVSSTNAQNLTGNDLVQTISGNNGNNILEGLGGNDTLNGNGGNDILSGGTGNDIMDGGAGNDVYFVDSALDQVNEAAGLGSDRVATSVSFTLNGGVSIETLETVSLSDTTAINLGGNAFNQTIIGNNGANTITSGGGNDILIAAGGDDVIIGAGTASEMYGGFGNDTYYVNDGSDVVIEDVGAGTDRIATTVSVTLHAGSEVEQIEAASLASTTAISLVGNEFANSITGNNGDNLINGKGGADVLNGAGGADKFAFDTALGAGNVDQILGFVSATDKIWLDNSIFAALPDGALAAGAFKVGAVANELDDRIIYNSSTGALYYDADGDQAGAAVQFATLVGHPALAASDFLVI